MMETKLMLREDATIAPSHIFNHLFNVIAEPTPIKMKTEDMSLEGMRFILNSSNYLYIDHTMEFPTCVTLFHEVNCRKFSKEYKTFSSFSNKLMKTLIFRKSIKVFHFCFNRVHIREKKFEK